MKKKLFGDPNFVSGDLFTGASRHNATWEKIQLGALERPAMNGFAARETSGKERLDLLCWMDLDLASKMSITAMVSYWDHMHRHVEKWQIWIPITVTKLSNAALSSRSRSLPKWLSQESKQLP